MDEHHKAMEAQLLQLQAEKEQLRTECEEAVCEKHDYTINEEKLADNIRSNLEQEFARKEQGLVQRLQHDLCTKIESKTTPIRTQYKAEFNTKINKLQNKWTQECLKMNADHNVQITAVLKEVEMLKQQSLLAKQSADKEPGAKVTGLQEKISMSYQEL